MTARHALTLTLGIALSASLASSALAGDGRAELNQACAVGGCFAGDEPGFPIEITAPGSYVLTSDLVYAGTEGVVVVAADFVSVDLSGHTVDGQGSGNVGSGIAADDAFNRVGMYVHGGRVINCGNAGVSASKASLVHDIRASGSASNGIMASPGSVLMSNVSWNNNATGMFPNSDSVARMNTVYGNMWGILAFGASVLEGNTARDNTADGIQAYTGSVASRNTSTGNTNVGIQGGHGVVMEGNTVHDNGRGLRCDEGCNLRDNTVRENQGIGVTFESQFGTTTKFTSAYSHNTITNNGSGAVTGGTNRFDNHCFGNNVGNPSCP